MKRLASGLVLAGSVLLLAACKPHRPPAQAKAEQPPPMKETYPEPHPPVIVTPAPPTSPPVQPPG